MKDKIFFWDMDNTLGNFEHVAYPELGEHEYSGLKEGIICLLSDLKSEGAKNFVTTSATRNYTEEALNKYKIIDYFEDVFTRTDTPEMYRPKRYKKILEHIDPNIKDYSKNVLIIGDSIYDSPNDLRGVVSIIDEYQFLHTSNLTRQMIDALYENGEGHFHNGFKYLYKKAKKLESSYEHQKKIGVTNIINGAELHLIYNVTRRYNNSAPMFWVKKADKYYKNNLKEIPILN